MAQATPEPDTFRASHRAAGVTARKARLVMDMIRGDSVEEALIKLRFCDRRPAPMIRKVLESAVANATQAAGLDPSQLEVYRAFADDGPTMKRWKPRSQGRAFPRLKHTSHLSVIVRKVAARPPAKRSIAAPQSDDDE